MFSFSHLSVRQKLIRLILLASALAFLCVTLAAVFFEATTFRPRAIEQLTVEAGVLDEVLSASLDFGLKEAAEKGLRKHCEDGDIVLAALYNTNALFALYRSEGCAVRLPSEPEDPGHQFTSRRLSMWRPIRNNENVLIGHLYLVKELPPLHARLPQYTIMTGAVLLTLAVVGYVLMRGLRHNVLRPLAALLDTTTQVTLQQDYGIRAAVRREDELGQLASAFNKMLDVVSQRDAALREASTRIENVFNSATEVLIVATDPQGVVTVFNRGAERILGYTAREVVGKLTPLSWHDAGEIEMRAAGLSRRLGRKIEGFEAVVGLAHTSVPEAYEWTYIRKDGSRLAVYLVVTVVRDVTGAVAGFLGVGSDVTERKRAEEAVRQSESNYREVFNASSDAIFVHEMPSGRLVDVNEPMLKMFGFGSKEQVLNRRAGDLSANTPPFTEVEAAEHIRKAMEQGPQVFEWLARKCDGTRFWTEVALRKSIIGGQVRVLASVRDISERKRAEVRIREQAALLEASHDAILVWDLAAGIQFMNPAAEELTGKTFAEARSRDLAVIMRARSELALRAATQEATTRGNWNGELELLTRDDKLRDVASRWTVLTDAQGKPASILITCNDITEKKRLEAQYLRVQRLESIGTLASGVAHDLNNILSPVLMGVELLSMNCPDEDTRGTLNMMRDSARRGADTVQQLLTFARGADSPKGPVQPRHLLKEIVSLLQQTFPKNIQIYTDTTGKPSTVLADPSQLHQVLMNLCVNARDAMPDGGVLFVTLEARALDESTANIHPKARPVPYVIFKVSDSGAGIPPEIMERIFDPFFTTKPQGKGTGLGLATVLGIVENHGGFVLVESKVGQGSTFQVFIPANAPAESAYVGEEIVSAPRGQGEVILIVDDEAAILHLAGEIARHCGYVPLTATSASEALHHYERNHERIRAVLTDIMMPFGDGRQLITMLYDKDPNLPIIAMSGLATAEFQRETLRRGASAFIRKPFTAEALLNVLGAALKRKP